jgi:hypothetical protein
MIDKNEMGYYKYDNNLIITLIYIYENKRG